MKSRAALLLLLATIVGTQGGATTVPPTQKSTSRAPTTEEVTKNVTLPEIKREMVMLETDIDNKLMPNPPEFIHPFTNPKDMLLEEIQSLDENATVSTKEIQEELARVMKAEAQRSRDKPRVTSTHKPRARVTPSSQNALFADDKSILEAKKNEKEALIALKLEEKELSYDEDNSDDDDEDDGDDDDDEDADDDYDDDDDEDADDEDAIENNDDGASSDADDIADEEELMTECPDYCRCSGQYAAATTAKCSKLIENQNFGSGIAHLRIENAGEINLGPQAIHSRGLQQLESITIVDTNIVRLDRSAFNGTDYLFALNLTRNGLKELEADYFENNTQLSLLTISGQPFDRDWFKSRDYIFNSTSIAELDFSDNSILRLPRAAFAKMPNLAFVDLKRNKLQNIDQSIFDSIDTLVELDLSGNHLNEIPEGVLDKGLQTLRISYNSLTSIGIQEMSKLTNLDVSHNRIKFIMKGDLTGANALEKLVVASNGIKRIHQHAFTDLYQLTYLDISDNKITSFNEHHLRTNARLQILIMNDNPSLNKLPVFKVFGNEYDTYAIYRFECANCGLDTLTEGTFDSMPALMKMNLARNRLARLPTGLLKSMSSLRELDLSDNMINTLEPKMFLGARTLLKLNLAGNPLVSLQVTPFLQTPGLSRLDVSRCQLRRIWSEARQPLKSLRFLSVRGNELKQITHEELKAMPKLSGLDVSHNPFMCDEEFNSAVQWLIDHGVTPTEVLGYVNNYGMAGNDYAETGGVSQWTDLARTVCDNDEDGPPSRDMGRKPIDHVVTFASSDDALPDLDADGLPDFKLDHDSTLDGKVDAIWHDQYQEYEDVNTVKYSDEVEFRYPLMSPLAWQILTSVLIALTLILLFVKFAHVTWNSKGRGPVIRPPMMLRQGLVDNKNCGLVYKPLQEEIATPHMSKRGSFYSSSTFHYDKIVPESV
ncbi:uncharacterized protein Gp150 [Venturia canescens]|uniref:uncharacterized protein Gp150 n=1 Tax=Venturia canescens TaxID=32260 RepID=UPI001C9CA33B|nr:uncharacterized protein LOC122407498 [Venturia canescens]XP_043269692.1 uncharacterized protein LOC122407498 [Venturia canescens]